jgi:hypothetical protein
MACEDAHLYCVEKPTSEKTVKVQIRNPYNGNTIECYQERFPLIRTEIPILTINKEMWDELKGERIPYQVELTAFKP